MSGTVARGRSNAGVFEEQRRECRKLTIERTQARMIRHSASPRPISSRSIGIRPYSTRFGVFDTFELYTGEPRTFPWAKNVVEFPDGHKGKVKESEMQQTGVAAAAKTDGRVGDGILAVREWNTGDKVVLPNHEVFQLAAGTLDPVASVGDLIILRNLVVRKHSIGAPF